MFKAAGYEYKYCITSELSQSSAFPEVNLSDATKGDVILFEGHMGIIEECSYDEEN